MTIVQNDLDGPRSIPVIGNLHQFNLTNLHIKIEEWSELYGPIFKLDFGPKRVTIVTDPDLIQSVLKNRPKAFRRIRQIDEVFSEMGMNGVFNAEGEQWPKHRKLIAKGLDIKHQQAYFSSIATSTNRLLKKWNNSFDRGAFNIQHDFLRFTVDVTSSLSFGYDINTIEQKGDVIQNQLEKIFPMLFRRITAPFPIWRYFKTKKDREFDRALQELESFITGLITNGKERLSSNPNLLKNPEHILDALLAATLKDDDLGDDEVKANILTLLVAGVDTSTYTMGWVIYHLCKYPDIQDRVREEVTKVLGSEHQILRYEQLAKLPLLDALCQESMRLKTVSPMLLHEANNEIELEGYRFKKDEIVLVESRYACMHNGHFSNAMSFDIDRWLGKVPNKSEEGHNAQAYIPFGSGPRLCPGRNLAQLEMRMVLSALIKNYQIEMASDINAIEEVRTFTVMPSMFEVRLSKI